MKMLKKVEKNKELNSFKTSFPNSKKIYIKSNKFKDLKVECVKFHYLIMK